MKKIQSKDTKAEIFFRKALWSKGCRYKLHSKEITGKPDIIFVVPKIVVFIDGDFWHGHNWEDKRKKLVSNKKYWIQKIERNMQRDAQVTNILTIEGWIVIRFWEHEIYNNIENCVAKVLSYIKASAAKKF